jgi:hypothetical protein
MNILLSLHSGKLKQQFFPSPIIKQLRALGNLRENPHSTVCTPDELKVMLYQIEVCMVMAWEGAPRFTERCPGTCEGPQAHCYPRWQCCLLCN